MTLLIRSGRGFHGDPPQAFEGSLLIDAGLVGGLTPVDTYEKVRVLDAEGCIVLPGLVTGHHHLYTGLARGMPGPTGMPQSLVEKLELVTWRLDRALDGDLVELSARCGAVEALRCGVTAIVDHHSSPRAADGSLDRVAAGLRAAGARGVLCYEASDRHGEIGFEAGLQENERFLSQYAGSTIRPMVGGHAPFTLSDDHLLKLAALAARHDVALHLHVAEDRQDQVDARQRGAANVTERLERAGVLDGRALLAHGVHLSPDEVDRLVEDRAWLTHQPRSNMNNHVGYLATAQRVGGRLALGTDGLNGDLLAEAQAAYLRLREHDIDGVADTVWSWLAGGWRLLSDAFGLPFECGFGWLNEGCPGDVVVLDYDSPTPVTAENLARHLVQGINARHVRHVVVAGEIVVRDGQPVRLDGAELQTQAQAGAERLWARMAEV